MVYIIKDLNKKKMMDKFMEDTYNRVNLKPEYDEIMKQASEDMKKLQEELRKRGIKDIETREVSSSSDLEKTAGVDAAQVINSVKKDMRLSYLDTADGKVKQVK